jgi:hypothetical protein
MVTQRFPSSGNVSVVTDNLGCEYESRYKKTVTQRYLNTPGFVGVSVITYNLGCEHKSGYKKLVTWRSLNTPGFVGVSVITDNLGCEHESRYEKTVTQRSLSSGEAHFELLKEDKGSKGYRRVKLCYALSC